MACTGWPESRQGLADRGTRSFQSTVQGWHCFPGGGETLLVGFNVGSELRKADLPEGTGFRVEISKESFSAGFSTGYA